MATSGPLATICNDSVFWNTSLTWGNASWPQFTQCFQNTILLWIPCFWLWLCLPLYLLYIYKANSTPIPYTCLNITKMTFLVFLITIDVILVTIFSNNQTDSISDKKAFLIGHVLRIITFILSLFLVWIEKKSGILTSGVQFIFWLLSILCQTIPFYSQIILKDYDTNLFMFIMICVTYGLMILELILFCYAEKFSIDSRGYFEMQSNEDLSINPCPEDSSSFINKTSFHWITRLIINGYKKSLDETNLWDMPKYLQYGRNLPEFRYVWDKELLKHKKNLVHAEPISETTPLIHSNEQTTFEELSTDTLPKKNSSKPSLIRTLFAVNWLQFLVSQIIKLLYDLLQFVSPQILSALISHTETPNDPEWKGYMLVLVLFATNLLQSFFYHQHFQLAVTLGIKIKSSLIDTVYRKALVINAEARSQSTIGEIVNLMAIDCERINNSTSYLYMLWSGPLQIILCAYLLWQQVGVATLAGLAVMLLLIPINVWTTSKSRKYQIRQMVLKDSRLRLMNEVLSGMKILKLYAWEGSLQQKILKIRREELAVLQKSAYLNAFSTFCWLCAPFLVTVATFTTYVLLKDDHYIDAQTAFVSLSLFNILKLPINMLPMAIPFLVQAHVAVTRLTKYLTADELNSKNVNRFYSDDAAVRIIKADFSWSKSFEPLLKNINLQFPLNKLIAIVGQVGAGKSSLISAILGEMEKLEGEVEVQGAVAYVPQEAWIQNKTVRDNILFGKLYNRKWYEEVIEACALKPDFATLPGGDRTEIGEKGINLSGGQKQRISLARAVYSNKDLYILDDPLSAVDAHVGKHIFNMVLSGTGLLKNKTRIFVTHGIHWLPKVEKVIVMSDGMVSEEGSYDELISHNGAFAQFLLTYLNEAEDSDPEINEVKTQILQRAASFVSSCSDGETENIISMSKRRESKVSITRRRTTSTLSKRSLSLSHEGPDQGMEMSKLIQEEKIEKGTVKIAVFLQYARALGLCIFTVVFILMILTQGSLMFANIWLSQWTDDPYLKNPNNTGTAEYNTKNYVYLAVYGTVGFIQGLIVLTYALIYAKGTIKAATSLHSRVLDNVIHCPMSFFDTTPIGRIINRFSRDVDVIDNSLAFIIRRWVQVVLQSIGTIIIIGYSTPDFLVIVLPIMIVYYIIQTIYIPTSRQLKRLESTTRSPIYTHFSETISGSSVIRAYSIEQDFIEESRTLVDKNQIYYFASTTSNRWLGIRLELVGNLIIVAASLFSILGSDVTGGLVGLSISYALQVTNALNMLVRMTSDLETNVVSVERLMEYSEIPREAEWNIPDKQPSESWPDKGQLEFIDYMTRYRIGLDLVLKGINCTIKPKEKIGIVGRTGAGKSSLTLSLFRIIEADKGCIVIDDYNIANLGLHDLRTKLTILPQEPLIFSGTLRMNLDPLENYEDSQLWVALELAHLNKFVLETLTNGLDYECGEGGQNLSTGQRQLVCLARALLRKTKILVLDEATAAVDMETDDLIQKTIRTEFKDCTILTIAHRLNTVMDYDKIMVLDNGIIREFDSPGHLLKNKNSIFYGMAKDSGIVS